MIKAFAVTLILASFALPTLAQTAPAPPPPPPGTLMQHDQQMQEMKAQIEKMRTSLDQMKASLAKIKDPSARQAAEANVDLWSGMIQHMEAMANHMPDHHDMPMMGGMHDGMGCCAGMGEMKGGECCGEGQCMQHSDPRGHEPGAEVK